MPATAVHGVGNLTQSNLERAQIRAGATVKRSSFSELYDSPEYAVVPLHIRFEVLSSLLMDALFQVATPVMWRLGDLPKLPEISADALVTLARGLRLIRGSKYLCLCLFQVVDSVRMYGDDDDGEALAYAAPSRLYGSRGQEHVNVANEPEIEAATPVASRWRADEESPAFHVKPAQLQTVRGAGTSYHTEHVQLSHTAKALLGSLLCAYRSRDEQLGRIVSD